MSIAEIKLYNLPSYTQTIEMSGEDYQIGMHYNAISDSWLMDINKPDGTPILSGRRVVPAVNMLSSINTPSLPKGSLYFVITKGSPFSHINKQSIEEGSVGLIYSPVSTQSIEELL